MNEGETTRVSKRKGSEEEDHSPSSSSSSITAKKKRQKQDNFTLESLKPFDFFITAPPIIYSHIYPLLSDWMEGVVNHDFTVKSNPFVINDLDKTSGLFFFFLFYHLVLYSHCIFIDVLDYYHQIQGLLHVINEPKKINENFEKFSIVDKILALSPSETWNGIFFFKMTINYYKIIIINNQL